MKHDALNAYMLLMQQEPDFIQFTHDSAKPIRDYYQNTDQGGGSLLKAVKIDGSPQNGMETPLKNDTDIASI